MTADNQSDEKRFLEWFVLKQRLHTSQKTPYFREREIRWYAAGENIGREVNGKGERFSRPILIIRKYGNASFFGVPLSSREHNGPWYEKCKVRSKEVTVLLSQAGSFSANRLFDKIDRISEDELSQIIESLLKLLFKK